ncbi:MAG: hypothetical protein CMI32_01360 [Opitutales bacterium]|nr:hypothetical protein [Opitutales bacterium]
MAENKRKQSEFEFVLSKVCKPAPDESNSKRRCLDLRGKRFSNLSGPSRRFFPTNAEAEKEFRKIWLSLRDLGRKASKVATNEDDLNDYVAARELLEKAGMEGSLTDFVRETLPKVKPGGAGFSLSKLFDLWIEAQEEKVRIERKNEESVGDDRRLATLLPFHGEEIVEQIDFRSVRETLNTICSGKSNATHDNLLTKLRGMLNYAVKEELVQVNWADKIDKRGSGVGDVGVYRVEEVRRIIEHARTKEEAKFLGVVVLTLLCGIRFSAARKMTWKDLDLEREDPKAKPRFGKNERSRFWVPLEPNAVEWLQVCPPARLVPKYSESYWRHFPRKLTETGGVEFRSNAWRHTFASYAAKHLGMDETRRRMGHKRTSVTLENHYEEYATKKASEAFFKLAPK